MFSYDSDQQNPLRLTADHYHKFKLFLLSHMLDRTASGINAPEAIFFIIVCCAISNS